MGVVKLTFAEKKAIEVLSLNTNSFGVITYSTLKPVMKVNEHIKVSYGKIELEAIKHGRRNFCSQYIELARCLEKIQIVESPATLDEIYEILETGMKKKGFTSLVDRGFILKHDLYYQFEDMSLLYPVEPYIYIEIVQN